MLAAASASPLITRQGVGVVATSPTASQDIVSAITLISDNINVISAIIIALKIKTDTATIAAIATKAFSTESNINSYY
jgi:hypothetical protein